MKALIGAAVLACLSPYGAAADDVCAKPYLTRSAVSRLCTAGDSRGVAQLVEKDNACRRPEVDEKRQARLAAGANRNGAESLTTLVRRMYHPEDGVSALQVAVDGVCWGVLHH